MFLLQISACKAKKNKHLIKLLSNKAFTKMYNKALIVVCHFEFYWQKKKEISVCTYYINNEHKSDSNI